MSIVAKFRINSDRVIIEIPDKNLYLEKPNTILYELQANCILSVGKCRESIEQENTIPPNLCFGTSFQYDDDAAGFFDTEVIEYYLELMYYANQPLPISIETVDFDLQIENYNLWPEKRQLKFEYDLQTKIRARYIKINHVDKETSIWKRRAEKFLQLLLLTVIPLGIFYYLGKKLNSASELLDLLGLLLGLLGLLLGVGLSFAANIAIWIFITRQLLPTSYNQFIFENLRSGSLTQKIANFILSFPRKE